MNTNTTTSTVTAREAAEVAAANASGKQPVVFVHGLWLLPSSWAGWRTFFEERGFATVAPDWPDDAATVDEAREHPERFAKKSVGQVADHLEEVIRGLDRKPVIIGHSFGGLLTQILAGRGLGVAAVAIDPAPSRGVLPLPFSSLKGAFPVLGNPVNYGRAVTLTFEEFQYGFANAVPEDEARRLYDEFHVAASGRPLFQAATANLNPFTEVKADKRNPERGPMLVVSGENDNIVPWAMANAAYKLQRKNEKSVTEITEIPGRGHSLVIDAGWSEVAQTSLDFLERNGVRPA
ncbi:alpha/beta hydrolase [Nocardioides guangzhouensis]|uniref:Alpha/beta hydrolase n=1 Tax=Nocardioides guangzhouensis TaxID=2497878 RepID=A0A4Q4ZG44_9ACTN|nr:alpha/beta hydrolase [Nocardioides guangzhouensis]RYP86695.1 alpha/beta hydrolase [Nocardioides guangzhouensis]